MYVGNLMAELFYFTLLIGGVFGILCFIAVMTIKAIATGIGYEVVQAKKKLNKWANN